MNSSALTIKIDKLIFGGQGLGHHDGKVVFVWNALPGEVMEVEVTKSKKDYLEGYASRIIEPSAKRVAASEDHFLSCGPWQIMSRELEKEWKIKIAEETFSKVGGFKVDNLGLVEGENDYGYRDKIEYSFWSEDLAVDPVSLAFFKRGQKRKQSIKSCLLADKSINDLAENVIEILRRADLSAKNLKSLIIRSNQAGETIAGLYLKDRVKVPFDEFASLKGLHGLLLAYSDPRSPASVITEIERQSGNLYLEEKIGENTYRYGLESFWQVNIPVYEKVLERVKSHIDDGSRILDYYSGVGSICLSLSNKSDDLLLIDSSKDAIDYANLNIEKNKIKGAKAICVPAEKSLEFITSGHTVIVDPHRAGLHKDVIKKLLEARPQTILYLSCNVSTQARDIGALLPAYEIADLKLYNFFPRTPHIESLCLLNRLA